MATKLTLVSYYSGGRKIAFFIEADVGADGKTRIQIETENAALKAIGCYRRGTTFTKG